MSTTEETTTETTTTTPETTTTEIVSEPVFNPADMLNFCDFYSDDTVKTKCKNFKNEWETKVQSGQIFDDLNNLISVGTDVDDIATDVDNIDKQIGGLRLLNFILICILAVVLIFVVIAIFIKRRVKYVQ